MKTKRYFKLIACLMAIVSLFVLVGVITDSKDSKTIEEPKNITPITTTPVSVKAQKADTVQAKPAVAKLLSVAMLFAGLAITTITVKREDEEHG